MSTNSQADKAEFQALPGAWLVVALLWALGVLVSALLLVFVKPSSKGIVA